MKRKPSSENPFATEELNKLMTERRHKDMKIVLGSKDYLGRKVRQFKQARSFFNRRGADLFRFAGRRGWKKEARMERERGGNNQFWFWGPIEKVSPDRISRSRHVRLVGPPSCLSKPVPPQA